MLRRTFLRSAGVGGSPIKHVLTGAVSQSLIAKEDAFSAHNYHPLPVVFATAKGCTVTDPEGRSYLDLMSGYGAVNQGHLHPRIVKAAEQQLKRCSLSCRAFHNDQFPLFAEKICTIFGYDKVLPMNTGAEAVETAVKLAKRYGYEKKGIAAGQAKVICMTGNFHGRTHLCISLSEDPDSYANYEPLVPGIIRVPYGDATALRNALEMNRGLVCGVIAEPVQGEAGVVFPPDGFLRQLRDLCTEFGALWIDDEIQSGLGRTGYLIAAQHENVRPDIVVLAKALGGGIVPISCVLADRHIMDVFTPGTHGSTFGGNPMACHVAMAALDVLVEEKLSARAVETGKTFTSELRSFQALFPSHVSAVRSRGLWGAIDFHDKDIATQLMYRAAEKGVLCKTTHATTLRLAPPLVISVPELQAAFKALQAGLAELTQ